MSSPLKRSIFADKNPQEYHTFMILLINYPEPYFSNMMSHSPDVYETEKPPMCNRISFLVVIENQTEEKYSN
jgi:hypothetical protein